MLSIVKKEKKYLFVLFVIVTGIVLVAYFPSIIKGVPITYGTDLKPQWFEFYTEFKRLINNLINNKVLPFYSWSSFLGQNFYSAKSYYLMGDIYSYIGLLLNENFFVLAAELTYLKFVVSAFTFYLLLTELNRKPTTKIVCSVAYAFSGWAIFYSGQLVFLSFYSLVPLYLLGIEKFIKSNRWLLFSISCAILFSTNWYFFYTLSALSPLYFVYRYICIKDNTKRLLISAIKVIGFYFVGSLISAFIWLPGILYIIGNNRFANSLSLFYRPIEYLNAIISPLISNYLYIYRTNIFDTETHVTREICTWSSSVLIVLLPQFIKFFNTTKRKLTIVLYCVFATICMFPFLDALLHGFSDPSFRWTFIIIIINLLVVSEVFDNINGIDLKVLRKTIMVFITVIVLAYGAAFFIKQGRITNYNEQTLLLSITVLLMMCVYYLCKKKSPAIKYLVIIEITLSTFFCYNTLYGPRSNDRYEAIDNLTHALQDHYGEVNESLNGLDKENNNLFYRVYVPISEIYGNFSHNMSLHYGIQGLMTYDSTYAPSFTSMYNMYDKVSSNNSGWIFDVKDDNLMNFLNTKYAIVTSSMKMGGDNWKLIDDNYHYGYHLYENTEYRPLGTTYNKIMTEDEFKQTKDTSLFLDTVIINPEKVDRELISSYLSDAEGYMYDINHYDNTLTAKYTSNKDGFMVMTIPYDEGWKILVDGNEIEYYQVNGGFIGFKVEQGEHYLEMYFIPIGFKIGCILSCVGVVVLMSLIIIIEKRKTKKLNRI